MDLPSVAQGRIVACPSGSSAGIWPGAHPEAGHGENEAGPEGRLTDLIAVARRPVDPNRGRLEIEGDRPQKVLRHQENLGPARPSDVLHPQGQSPERKLRGSSAPRLQSVCPQQVLQTMNRLQTEVGGMCTRRLANGSFILRQVSICT